MKWNKVSLLGAFSCLAIVGFVLSSAQIEAQPSPYPRGPVIKAVTFEWSSHLRLATGSDNWPVTWAGDGHQYVVWGDGGGWTSADGKNFTLIFTGRKENDSFNIIRGKFSTE